jgi:hypothetical protein
MSAVGGSTTAPSMLPCRVCGRGPTALISVSRNVGMLVLRRSRKYSAPLCRDHGSQLARNWLLATLLMGSWGFISFFVNFGAVATDLKALRAARRLPPPGSVIVPAGLDMAGSVDALPPQVSPARLALVAAGIAVVIVAGVINATFGPKSATDLAVGDCFDASTAGVISEVPHHPCSMAHTAEVFDILTYTGGQSGTYPTDAEFQAFAVAQCESGFNAYTGGGGGVAATVDLAYGTPTTAGWSSGDRRIVCYLAAPTGQTLSQSLRSATQ